MLPLLLSTVKYSFFQPRESNEDIALEGFLLRQVRVASDIECGLRCSQYACASFTVQQSGSRGPRLCELYKESAKSKPTSVIKRTGFRYYERIHVYYWPGEASLQINPWRRYLFASRKGCTVRIQYRAVFKWLSKNQYQSTFSDQLQEKTVRWTNQNF